MHRRQTLPLIAGILALVLVTTGFGFRKKKYDNPITKDTLQPDKVLFDRAIKDIEHGRYEVARLTLNTLINTYDTSEFLAKAKLAIADSWYREGGAHGLAQAEAEYKDFELFYPNMAEAAEAQMKICGIHYRQMEKADRDPSQAQRTEDECRDLLTKYPNSFNVKDATQMLRSAQEVLADKEFRTGAFYHTKGSFPAAANRLSYVSQQYPLYSGSDEALWELADSYARMGDRFENQQADALTKIVRDYPLSDHVDDAKAKLESMKRPVPDADPVAMKRMEYELANRVKPGMMSRGKNLIVGRPDTHLAAKMGDPSMSTIKPPIPVSVPKSAAGGDTAGSGAGGAGVSDVVVGTSTDTSLLDKSPDARANRPDAPAASTPPPAANNAPGVGPDNVNGAPSADPATQQAAPLPSNHSLPVKKQKKAKAKKDTKTPATTAAPADSKPDANAKPDKK